MTEPNSQFHLPQTFNDSRQLIWPGYNHIRCPIWQQATSIRSYLVRQRRPTILWPITVRRVTNEPIGPTSSNGVPRRGVQDRFLLFVGRARKEVKAEYKAIQPRIQKFFQDKP